jgi:selenocysteine lyase/cysteine desulfurase
MLNEDKKLISRRDFVQLVSLAGLGIPLTGKLSSKSGLELDSSVHAADSFLGDRDFWKRIQRYFNPSRKFINLENGYCSPQALPTMNYHICREEYINSMTSKYTREEMPGVLEIVRTKLADFLSVSPEELAFTRNTTESMNIVIMGYPWEEGDEVVIGDQDYGSMVQAYQQTRKRCGIVIREAAVPLLPDSDEEIVDSYMSLCNSKTKIVHLTHLIHLSGQVIPVAKIARAAHDRGIEVVVDAAHSIAHINCTIPELEADYVGASLHKWLCCPLGNGFLWMKKGFIPGIWPLMGDTGVPETDIRRFEHQGTRPYHSIEAISKAIDFHNMIGGARKEERLKYLMKRWVSKVVNIPKVKINNPWDDDGRNSAIANFSIDGLAPSLICEKLMKNYKIFTVAIVHPAINGVRVTPHLYTTEKDVDLLARAIRELAF